MGEDNQPAFKISLIGVICSYRVDYPRTLRLNELADQWQTALKFLLQTCFLHYWW